MCRRSWSTLWDSVELHEGEQEPTSMQQAQPMQTIATDREPEANSYSSRATQQTDMPYRSRRASVTLARPLLIRIGTKPSPSTIGSNRRGTSCTISPPTSSTDQRMEPANTAPYSPAAITGRIHSRRALEIVPIPARRNPIEPPFSAERRRPPLPGSRRREVAAQAHDQRPSPRAGRLQFLLAASVSKIGIKEVSHKLAAP